MNLSKKLWRLIDYISPVIPGGWRLPLRFYSWSIHKMVEPELIHLFDLCKNYRGAIDIGANHGFYAYKMLQRFKQVYAFEANNCVDFDICHFTHPNLHFYPFGLSNIAAEKLLNIPIQSGVAYDGWASLEERQLSFADKFNRIPVSLQKLDDQEFTKKQPIDLIKIDVEGHETEVILGSLETIRRYLPVLIIENNENQEQLCELLFPLGYSKYTFYQLTGKPLDSPNLIFVCK